MLTLNRRVGEAISVSVECPDGSLIEFAFIITDLVGRQIKLGFEAPTSVSINREEIAEPNRWLKSVREAHHRRFGVES